MKVTVKALFTGQEVAVANCRATGHVVRRLQPGLYEVRWEGKLIRLPRTQIGVRVHETWRFGAHNTTDTASK